MDLQQLLLRQMAFSQATFGPGERTAGIVDHLRKELDEIIDSGGDESEWVDAVILSIDGLMRRVASRAGEDADPEYVAQVALKLVVEKQDRNEARSWPDWRGQSADKAIEHDRTRGVQ